MSAPTALYRRYRPDSFATVIGQEHVTAPLMAALDKNRVNHAYLFSGPRGCGKTTSARILARCLNCAKGPTSHPCGECDSCVELARGGAGSLDVIEIDAASHGGVDDARDLRERATFAPIRDRYKIFIIDEAHMVTSAGFNALLKIVEEPPEHIKFIFATTEPDKVIGTIRSRTHHYPFRLVPPEPLMAYLAQLCEQENVAVAPGVLSLVVRAGGGSVRDSLSVLDQLMAGANATGLDYDLAVDLLGYTHSSLLDDVVESLAASDSGTVFKSIDRVIQTGHDPRRFVEDLLERFRDLIIVQAMPESAHAILRGVPEELIARMQTQAAQLGAAELSRAADVTNAAFNEMTGATSPRLHLELLGARLLLPGADSSTRGMATRLDQLERRLNYSGTPVAVPSTELPAAAPQQGNPAQNFPVPSSAPASYESATGISASDPSESAGGGLAAVRAQLARAKEAAGAEVAARQTSGTSPAGVQTPESSDQPAPTEPSEQLAAATPPAQPAPSVPAAPQPRQQTHPSDSGQPQQTARPARTWDDLPTPSGNVDFMSQPQDNPAVATPAQNQPSHPSQFQPEQHQPSQLAPTQSTPPEAAVNVGGTPPAGMPTPGATAASQSAAGPSGAGSSGAGSSGIEVIRRAWPEIIGALRNIRMASWVIVNQNVVPQTFDGQELRVGLPSTGLIAAFSNGGHLANLQQAINEVLGLNVQILPVDGEAPKASSEPNPKVRTGNPSPQRGGPGNTAAPQLTDSPSQGQPAAPVDHDSWGLPVESVSAPAPKAVQAPAPTPARREADATSPSAVHSPASPVSTASAATTARTVSAVEETAPWDGPPEPSDQWDEPYPDFVPPADLYESVASYPPEDSYPSNDAAPPTGSVAPAAAPAYSPPKISPIAAWTTGWDSPAVEAPVAAPAAPETPRRSELLAQQAAQQAAQPATADAPQDWGVSLGQTRRSDVADPGWGDVSAAPDWAQPATADSGTVDSGIAGPVTADSGATSSIASHPTSRVAEPATPAASPEFTPAPASNLAEAPGHQSPGDASVTAPAQEDPASNVSGGGEKLSMYQRLANSPAAQAARVQTPAAAANAPYVEDVPSPDDVTIEESGVVGQAAVERILGGVLIEERPLNNSH
ncbi:DNA polymerase III subunit gamma and tau [Specibacter sp. NPDC078709]|uniref:DNA polymerase III subunit gamma and tau n=1 Tax=Specibacter sp. NPDC078709 TaxID=3154364 RepID=UPI0034135E0F